jgi:predicted permease
VRQVLIASEIAFAVVLLIGTGLMVRTFAAMRAVDPGFTANGVMTMQVPLAESSAGTASARLGYYESLLAAVRAQPSVRSAAMINHLPLDGDEWGTQTYGGLTAESPEGKGLRSVFRVVTPGYFSTMRIALEAGRDVNATDDLAHPRAVVINRRLATTLWPGEDPIGKRLSLSPPGVDREWSTVIGVAANTKQSQWTASPEPELYLPYAQTTSYLEGPLRGTGYLTLVVRTAGDPSRVVAAARAYVHAVDPTVPLTHVQSLPSVVDRMSARSRFVMLVLVGFAMLALSLAAVGIYGVMSYSVAQRRQEIGIKIALGAPNRTVMLGLLRQAATVSTFGIVVGSGCALLLTRFLVAQLYGVRPTDPLSFGGAAIVLGAVALAASSVPIARALRIDPLTAIRSE